MSQIDPCKFKSTPGAGVKEVNSALTKDTTPKQFDALVRSFPKYKFDSGDIYGQNALASASEIGNVTLFSHIIKE